MKVDLQQVEEAAKELYIRALKLLPPDIKQGFERIAASESDAGAKRVIGTMIKNISVAEDQSSLLCQDTGIPIYNVSIGRGVEVDGYGLKEAIRRGCARSTKEHPFRSSVVHPTTRANAQDSTGRGVPVINIDFVSEQGSLQIEMIPKGSGSENNSWLKMAIPAEGVDAVKTFVVDCVLEAGGKTCPPTIVGVGVGGTADLCVHLAKIAVARPLGSRCEDPEGAKLEEALTKAVNMLGVGPQGLGGDSTAFAVHVETAATHITMNPVAVNMQCHSARRARGRRSSPGRWNMVFRVLLAILIVFSAASSSHAAEVAGVKIPDEDLKLVLNGAGLRKRAFFQVYVIGLYLPEKKTVAAEAIAVPGPKRVLIHMLRDVDADQFGGALTDGMKDNVPEAEMKALEPRIKQLQSIMLSMKEAKKGMRITLDSTAAGTAVTIDGKPAGQPIPGEDFYRALLKIWLGDKPVQPDLKGALLGEKS